MDGIFYSMSSLSDEFFLVARRFLAVASGAIAADYVYRPNLSSLDGATGLLRCCCVAKLSALVRRTKCWMVPYSASTATVRCVSNFRYVCKSTRFDMSNRAHDQHTVLEAAAKTELGSCPTQNLSRVSRTGRAGSAASIFLGPMYVIKPRLSRYSMGQITSRDC